jgi:hypothetical protein
VYAVFGLHDVIELAVIDKKISVMDIYDEVDITEKASDENGNNEE